METTHSNPLSDALITTNRIAKCLGVKTETIRRWVRERRIPAYRIGKKTLRFDLHEVRAELKRQSLLSADGKAVPNE